MIFGVGVKSYKQCLKHACAVRLAHQCGILRRVALTGPRCPWRATQHSNHQSLQRAPMLHEGSCKHFPHRLRTARVTLHLHSGTPQ